VLNGYEVIPPTERRNAADLRRRLVLAYDGAWYQPGHRAGGVPHMVAAKPGRL
jgi:hypothetical protein